MNVRQLRELLKHLDQDLEVMIDTTKEGSEMFHFEGLDGVEEVELDNKEKIVALFLTGSVLDNELNEN